MKKINGTAGDFDVLMATMTLVLRYLDIGIEFSKESQPPTSLKFRERYLDMEYNK